MPTEDIRKMGHLMRRAGFGADYAELERRAQKGMDATIQELLNSASASGESLTAPDASAPGDAAADEMIEAMTRMDKQGQLRPQMLRPWWVYRMATTDSPLLEKMTLFWHGHFATSANKVGQGPLMLQQNRFFRENALGNWRTILRGISRDPAMIAWLDNNQNYKAHPNENYARELMELFTLGIGHYTETDIKESARAFTGWSHGGGCFVFNARQHDTGLKTFLGQTGNFDGDDIIDIILDQPASAEFLTRKLFTFFAYANPEPEVVSVLADKFRKSDYDVGILISAIFHSPAFWSPAAINTQIKSPVQLVVGSLRLLAVGQALTPSTDDMMMATKKKLGAWNLASTALRQMGQDLFYPPDVKGWDGGAAWINSATMLERVNFASRLANSAGFRKAPGSLNGLAAAAATSTPEELVDTLLANLGPLDLSPASRQTLIKAVAGDGQDRGKTHAYQKVARLKDALAIAMGSSRYQYC